MTVSNVNRELNVEDGLNEWAHCDQFVDTIDTTRTHLETCGCVSIRDDFLPSFGVNFNYPLKRLIRADPG